MGICQKHLPKEREGMPQRACPGRESVVPLASDLELLRQRLSPWLILQSKCWTGAHCKGAEKKGHAFPECWLISRRVANSPSNISAQTVRF